ncbi:MAG TPA: response regulator [Polyangiaceae bacterium]|nr:response regulator [Polyangiaceae bacterium]
MNAVMVVEDEQLIAKDIADTLTKLGYDVTGTVSSAEACVESAETQRPDLVLMDIHLQGELDGIEAARLLRERFDIPVVFLSAYADEGTVARAKLSAPLGYLLKPFRKSELRSAVEVGLFRHQMERQLRERERWFSTTLRAIGDAVVAVDATGQISFMNRAAEKLIGRTESGAKGKPLQAVFRLLNEKTREPVPDPIQEALAGREVVRLPANTSLLAGERELPVEDSVAPIVDERGERLGAVIVMRDMTEDRRARQQIAAADRLASLGTVAAGIAHEINNPLTYILGNVSFLSEELERVGRMVQPLLPSHRQEDVAVALGRLGALISEVEEGASRVSRIVADLGLFGRREQEEREGDAIAALDWALRVSHTALSRVARVRRNLEPIPKVRGDEGRLGQVFLNMLLNAAHAMQDGDPSANELSVSAALEPRADGPAQVRITIKDTGSGMTADVLDRIFDPFFTTKPVGTGTGLGLSVCHGVVEELGGTIRVSSEPGRGSTFVVRLPTAGAEQVLLEEPEPEPELSGARGRILIIDDEPRVLSVLSRMLGGTHDVVAVGGAQEALEQLGRGQRFDVIVCDLLMPEMSGIELYHVLEQQAPQLAQRMIFLSGGANTSMAGEFLSTVPNQALEKPPARMDLLRAIDLELRSRPSHRPLPSAVVPRDPGDKPN